jgi:hypothetical protein
MSDPLDNTTDLKRIQDLRVKKDAFYHCYPMVRGKVDDPLHYQTWETFSYVWDLAIRSAEARQ